VNWLVPVDANPTAPHDLDFQMVDAKLVLRQLEDAGTKLNLVILDACRSNPFDGRGLRGAGGGLAEMQAPEGTLISYAAQPRAVAADGAGGDSPYTLALADAIRQPGLDVFRIFNQVGLAVKQATGGTQLPWLASSPISVNFYFFTGPTTIAMPQRASPAALVTAPAPIVAPSASAFDGNWMVYVACDGIDGAQGFRWSVPAVVSAGHLHGVRGVPGMPDYADFTGTIEPDGTAKFSVVGRTENPGQTVNNVAAGSKFSWHATGSFSRLQGSATRIEQRPCSLDFIKQ
jgi:hypothetical protein